MKKPKSNAGRPEQEETLDAQIHIRLAQERKSHYVRFFARSGTKLSAGIIEAADKATGYKQPTPKTK